MLMLDLTAYTDEQLMASLALGDEAAFTEIYDRYWKRLLVRTNLLLNSHQDAEEVVHDIFVQLWRKRATITIMHTLHTYIAAMLQYRCFEVLAGNRRRRMVQAGDVPDSPDYSTEHWLQFEQLREQLDTAINALPDKCRLIFRLSREEGLTDKQIATELDISVNTVRTQMHRALTKLKGGLHNFFLL